MAAVVLIANGCTGVYWSPASSPNGVHAALRDTGSYPTTPVPPMGNADSQREERRKSGSDGPTSTSR
ncbi:MAG: hypothetical protein K0U78_12910 [Actinomycetia bacterium]|nr:hypothetical protein [Actinomycetes bacterium]